MAVEFAAAVADVARRVWLVRSSALPAFSCRRTRAEASRDLELVRRPVMSIAPAFSRLARSEHLARTRRGLRTHPAAPGRKSTDCRAISPTPARRMVSLGDPDDRSLVFDGDNPARANGAVFGVCDPAAVGADRSQAIRHCQ